MRNIFNTFALIKHLYHNTLITMKKLFVIIFSAGMAFALPQTVYAQSLLKKIGNVVNKVDKVLSQKQPRNSHAESNLAAMPGVSFKYIRTYHDGLGATTEFTLTNNSGNTYDITFNGTDGLDGWSKSQAAGGDGAARSCYVSSIDGKYSMDMVTRYRLLPGATAKGYFKTNRLDRAITSMSGISVAGLWQANEDNNNHNFRFTLNGPLEIVTPANTTQKNVICTLPDLAVSYDKAERKNGNVIFHFTLTNTGSAPITLHPNFGYVKDAADKDDYKFGVVINGKELGGNERILVERGKPVKGMFGIINVPLSVKAMNTVLWMLEKPEYMIRINNPSLPVK